MIFSTPPVATVAMNLRPRSGSWGGANQWAAQIVRALQFHNWRVQFDLKRVPDVILMTHTGLSSHTTFEAEDVMRLKERNPAIPCVQRINDNDIRKDTLNMDVLLARSNRVADHTVFVSDWLRDYHATRWFDSQRTHSVIIPGADPRFFHPVGSRKRQAHDLFRLVTHHWSDNWKKGFDVYRELDSLIAGPLQGQFEFWMIGRWPEEIRWQAARTFPPTSGAALAGLLRQCDGYVSASRFEPGAMHVAEGLQCGLPLLYHRDSGGTVEQGKLYGCAIGDDLESSLQQFQTEAGQYRDKLLAAPPSGSQMAYKYLQLMQTLIVHA